MANILFVYQVLVVGLDSARALRLMRAFAGPITNHPIYWIVDRKANRKTHYGVFARIAFAYHSVVVGSANARALRTLALAAK